MPRYSYGLARRSEVDLPYWQTEDGKVLGRRFQQSQVLQTGLGLLGDNAIGNQSALFRRAVMESGGDPLLAQFNLRTVATIANLYNQDLLSYGFPRV